MSDWEIVFGGVTLGASPYPLEVVEGLHDTPEVVFDDRDRPRQNGQYPGRDFNRGRSITAKGTARFTIGEDEGLVVGDFSRAMVSGKRYEEPLFATYPGLADGRQVLIMAKVREQTLPIDEDYRAGAGRYRVRWWCTDPNVYDAELTSLVVVQATTSGTGAALPLALPVDLGGPISGGLLTATNEGEVDAPWVATINGPVNGPRIENVTTGQRMAFLGNLAAGETLIVDSRHGDVLLNGDAARQTWIAPGSEWFDLAPGVNVLRFAGAGGPGTLQLDFRSTWI